MGVNYMKLSINLASAVPKFGIEGSMELYKNAGFDAMDFSLCDMVEDCRKKI